MISNKPIFRFIFFLSLSIFLVACETVGYYSQAARGQLEILTSSRSFESLLADESTDPMLKARLEFVQELKVFAQQELSLPQTKNFSSYANLDREHVVWNVFAAPEFSTNPVSWCYPIAGCVSYRGYFEEAAAQQYAQDLSAKGFEVYTGGVDAYSTLGWFNDPLLSTVIDRVDYQLAALLFHELAHLVVYVEGDTRFNESFATTVEREGVKRWLTSISSEDTIQLAEQSMQQQDQFVALIADFQTRFSELYESEMAESVMRDEKLVLQQQLRDQYAKLKTAWQGYTGYDSWFGRSLNNAQLSTVSSYNDLVPFFQHELERLNGDFEAFYERVSELGKMAAADRDKIIGVQLAD